MFVLQTTRQVVVEELVVADLVARDIPANLFQYRLAYCLAQRRVVGACSNLHHAARYHFSRARAPARRRTIEVDAKPDLEPPESRCEIEFRIGQRGPPPERLAMPHLLLAPASRIALKLG